MMPDWTVVRVSLLAVLVAWSVATIVLTSVYAVKSVDNLGRLVIAACAAASPAMWFPPATLLLANSSPAFIVAGVGLVVNAARLLVSRSNPRKRLQKRRKTSEKQRFFIVSDTRADLGAAVAGAIVFQAGFCAIWTGFALVAAVLFVFAAAIWTQSSIKKGANDPGRPRPAIHAALSIVLMVLLTTAAPVPDFASIAFGESPDTPTPQQNVTKVVTRKPEIILPGSALVPGVIFRPEVKRDARAAMFVAPRVLRPLTVGQPLSIAFTGEYHLFPTSSGSVQKDATVYRGTPMDAEYVNTSGGPLETEAHQRMEPPLELAHCGAIQVNLLTAERTPALASMHLIAEGRTVDLGSEVFGLGGRERETLEFTVPGGVNARVREIRLVFRGDPARRNHSAKVAIESFVLLPRGT